MPIPKVFISYSWNPFQNKQKVIELAERLSSNSVHVIIDIWDLREGQEKYAFMEQMVNDPEVKRVLLICNKDYQEKANKKTGGVGIESLIISDKIYNEVEQTKFLPIIFEYDENGKPYLPTYVHSRIYIDLSNENIYEDNYEVLLRNIHDKPIHKRPPIGPMPSFLLSEEPIYLPTANKVVTIKNALINEKKNAALFIEDYYDSFLNALKEFYIEEVELNNENYREEILKKLEELRILRDDFITFVEVYFSYTHEVNLDKLHNFFERLVDFLVNIDGSSFPSESLQYLKSDHFRYFFYELFLCFSTILLEKEKFSELAFIIQTPYLILIKNYNKLESYSFIIFRQYVHLLNRFENEKLGSRRVSVTADFIKQRASSKYNFDKLKETDLILYYLSLFFPDSSSFRMNFWFPETSAYRNWNYNLFAKAISCRYFDKIKVLFGVDSKEQLIEKLQTIKEQSLGKIQDFNFSVPDIKVALNIENICTFK